MFIGHLYVLGGEGTVLVFVLETEKQPILLGCLSFSYSGYQSLSIGRIANVFSSSALQLAFSFSYCPLVKRCFQISIQSNLQIFAFTVVLFSVQYRILIIFKRGNLLEIVFS